MCARSEDVGVREGRPIIAIWIDSAQLSGVASAMHGLTLHSRAKRNLPVPWRHR